MTLQEAAEQLGINLEVVLERLCHNESLYIRLLKRIPEDKNFESLKEAVQAGNYEEVEMTAHTIKGVAGNLGLEDLQNSSDAMVQAVRSHKYEELDQLFSNVEEHYLKACEILLLLG